MKNYLLTLSTAIIFILVPRLALADGHVGAEDAVSAAIANYWADRNAGDHETVANLESPAGIYGSNSDGSFHKLFAASSADSWKRNMAGQKNNMRVTNVWTPENDGEWRIKAMHFSSSGYGGTHRTQTTDFED